jgi:multidrug transporter EmrE-like cation transporter
MIVRLSTIFLLVLYVVVSVAGLTLLKSESNIVSVRFAMGFLLYGLGFSMWYVLLRMMPLSVAFPVAAGSLIAGTQVAGKVLLQEKLGSLHVIGVGVIILGVILVFSQQ